MKVALGTMVVGDQLSQEAASALVHRFFAISPDCKEVDTAFMYPCHEMEGSTETMLGSMLLPPDALSTKANAGTAGGLSAQSVRAQLEGSLHRLRVPCVDIFYLHWPDHKVPILETLAVVAEMFREGKFKRFGLSNYAAWEVVSIYHTCKERGWVLPTVYQGLYNCLSRGVEPELLVALRKYGITFYAYNITAGGLLNGNPNSERFTKTVMAERYRNRYVNERYLKALETLTAACAAEFINPVDAGIRWLVHHSKLDASKDVLVVGASKIEHLEANVQSALKGKALPDDIVKAMDEAAALAKPSWPSYFR